MPELNVFSYLMVLNDGETYTSLEGCKIVRLKKRDYDDEAEVVKAICEDQSTVDGEVVTQFIS